MNYTYLKKRFLAAVLMLTLVISLSGCGKSQKPAKKEEVNKEFTYSTEFDGDYYVLRNGLYNTYNKIKAKEDITISFLGGSITYGIGTQSLEESFRILVKNWLSETYGINVNEYNAAIPSACSGIGAYCVEEDVLIHNPDIVFIEYAINDKYARAYYSESEISANMETIVRKIKTKSPKTDIVFLYTTSAEVSISTPLFFEAEIHEKVAEHYGVTSINIGYGLRKGRGLLKHTGSDVIVKKWSNFFKDGCHTNKNGNIVYSNIIKEAVESAFSAAEKGVEVNTTLPEQLNKNLINTTYIKTSNADLTSSKGFKMADTQWSSFSHYKGYIYTDTADNELSVTFNGTSFGILGPVNQAYLYSVDGGDWVEFSKFNSHPQPLVKGLENKEHTIKIKATDIDNNQFIISAFLIGA